MRTDLTLVLQIALVGDDDNGKVVPVLDAEDLGVEGGSKSQPQPCSR
jgi:hypothetical protein